MLTAADIMNPHVVTISGLATVAAATRCMRQNHTRTLIIDRRHPHDAYGILTATDISSKVIAYGRDPHNVRVHEIMSKPCIAINPDLAVEYVARLFSQWNSLQSAPVIREKLLGIITVEDLITKSDFLEHPKEIFFNSEIKAATAHARHLCEQEGLTSENCRAAWSKVQALEAEAAYQQSKKIKKTVLERYVEENPNAADSLMIENWCSG